MTEKHICKLCSKPVEQLGRHLTMTHSVNLLDYLTQFNCGEEYQRIQGPISFGRRISSPFCIEFYKAKNLSDEECQKELQTIQKQREKRKTFPASVEHWMTKGMKPEDAEIRAAEYRKSIGGGLNLERAMSLYGKAEGEKLFQEHKATLKKRIQKNLQRLKQQGLSHKSALIYQYLKRTVPKSQNSSGEKFVCAYSYSNYKSYTRAVQIATGLSVLLYRELIDPSGELLGRNYAKKGWGLDHQFSKYGGFYHRIDPLIISRYQNLRIITHSENLSKGGFCTLSLDEIRACKTILDDEEIETTLKEQIREIFVQTS